MEDQGPLKRYQIDQCRGESLIALRESQAGIGRGRLRITIHCTEEKWLIS